MPYGKESQLTFCHMALAGRQRLSQNLAMSEYPKLRTYREAAGLSQDEIADRVGLSVSQISRYENGIREPYVRDIRRLASVFKTSVADLIDEAVGVDVPLVSWVSAGRLSLNDPVRNVDVEAHMLVPDLPPGEYLGLRVDGDSMDRIAPHGSIIIVDRKDNEPRENRFYVFGYDDDRGTTFKRYKSGNPPRLQPFSTNPDHETIHARGKLIVVGRVRRVITDL